MSAHARSWSPPSAARAASKCPQSTAKSLHRASIPVGATGRQRLFDGGGRLMTNVPGCRWLPLAAALALGACTVSRLSVDDGPRPDDPNLWPANYRSEILAMLRVYFPDPTGIRDAGVSEPVLQSVGDANRYVVCLQLNAKKGQGQYAGRKEYAAIFLRG